MSGTQPAADDMKTLRHISLIASYAVLAGGVAVYMLQWRAQVGEGTAVLGGALLFLSCALLHEIYGRIGRVSLLSRQFAAAMKANAELREDLSWTQKEVAVIRETLAAVAEARQEDGARALEEMMAEVKVMRSLVGRLSGEKSQPDAGSIAGSIAGADDKTASPPAGAVPAGRAAGDPAAAPPLDEARIVDLVREALRDDRVNLLVQPIVSLPQRKHRFYECYSQLSTADGTVVVPEQYIAIAQRKGMITAIDNMLLFRCIQVMRRIRFSRQNVGFFCNVSSNSLRDEDFFGDFVEYLELNPELAPNLVFEFAQDNFLADAAAAAGLLGRLARLGCRCSIDHVETLDLDVEALARHHVDFVKIEMAAFLTDDADQRTTLLNLKRRLDREGIDLIAEKIESEDALLHLIDYGIDFGQGYLLGEPRLAKSAA